MTGEELIYSEVQELNKQVSALKLQVSLQKGTIARLMAGRVLLEKMFERDQVKPFLLAEFREAIDNLITPKDNIDRGY